MHRIAIGGDIMGALFALGTSLVFLIEIPATRLFLLASVFVGVGVAGLLYVWHKRHCFEHTELYEPPRPKEDVSGAEFVEQLQAAITKVVGPIVAACVVQSQLERNFLTAETCSQADCKKLVDCTVEAIGLFATKEETTRLQFELEVLYHSGFPSS
jgi:hypothetical protein